MKFISIATSILFSLFSLLLNFSQAESIPNSPGNNFKWEPLNIQATSILSVKSISENEVLAGGYTEEKGSMLLYSKDKGETWESLPSTGNNLDIAISKDRKLFCGVGTKVYCAHIPLEPSVAHWELSEIPLKASPHQIESLDSHGFAIVGQFRENNGNKDYNGVVYNRDLENNNRPWQYTDINLSLEDGYYAQKGSFPTNTTWYVVSGSWPIQNPLVSTMLSGKLNLVPGRRLLSYNFEFLSLNHLNATMYKGAISKTTDGGQTWQKVFDTNNQGYFNEIDCYDELHCITLTEGSFSTSVLSTGDGGMTWNNIMELKSEYSLHSGRMLSTKEIWVSGGMTIYDSLTKENKYMGIYYHSIDGGANWSLKTLDGYAYSMGFFNKDIGYAAILHKEKSGIAKLSLREC